MDTVKNGKEKQQAYTHSFEMLSKAMNYEFYLEAVAITYAIMEDRLVSFLHHAGIVTRDKGDLRINRRLYPYMRALAGKPDDYAIKIKEISVKLKLIERILQLSDQEAKNIDALIEKKAREKRINTKPLPGYMNMLYQQVDKTIDRDSVNDLLKKIDTWRGERNQLIHALLSKTVETSQTAKKECAKNGCDLARSLDKVLVKTFKRRNGIRKKYNIQ